MLLKDKVAFITGGARGIGREIAEHLAKEGAKLAICDVNEATLENAKAELGSFTGDVITLKVDVTKSAEVEEAVNKILDKYGCVDILVNNAGITKDTLLVRMKEEEWDLVLAVNLKGAFLCTKAVAKVMMKQRSGRIVNMASVIGLIGNIGQANYAASKGGLIAFTKTCARELASRNITVNAVAPGFIKTQMTDQLSEDIKEMMLSQIPMKSFGGVGDVARAVVFLSSELSSYITGQVINVDGGLVM